MIKKTGGKNRPNMLIMLDYWILRLFISHKLFQYWDFPIHKWHVQPHD